MELVSIYGLVDPRTDAIRYVGKTKHMKRRLSEHINDKEITKKANWIKKLRSLNLKPTIIELDSVPETEHEFWEIYWIAQLKAWGIELLNGTNGGDNPQPRYGEENSFRLPGVKEKIQIENR